ncbi:MAG: TetR/AcrR family transcriptional regulator [Solirubrobacterales bacterium]
MAAKPQAGPRRLPWDARFDQLVEAAVPLVAERGLGDFSLDEIAARSGVTRNLLYHYFPRGRRDIVLAAADRAGRLLTDDWVTDEAIPLEQRIATNVGRVAEHASGPSDAWRIFMLARTAGDPELREMVDSFVEIVISSISLNQIGDPDPPPLVRLALLGYLAFFESVLDGARETGASLVEVAPVLEETLVAAIQAAASAGEAAAGQA